jgi:hypothetical protein
MKSQIKKQNGGNCGVGSCPLQLGGHKKQSKKQSGGGCGCAGNGVPKLLLGGKRKNQKSVKKSKSRN